MRLSHLLMFEVSTPEESENDWSQNKDIQNTKIKKINL